ncbi:MAG: hypothetical protein ACI97N_002411 [Cognaticolwellia sp.]|jgi:hypothetical protein
MFCFKVRKWSRTFVSVFEVLELEYYTGVSETARLKIMNQLEGLILKYKEAVEAEITEKAEEVKVILGVDETWFANPTPRG